MKEIVLILSHLHWDFPADYVKQTAKELAKKAKVVVFNPQVPFSFWKFLFNKKARKEYFRYFGFFPLGILPFQRIKLIEKINIYFGLLFFQLDYFFHFGLKKPILWVFTPELMKLIPKKRKILVYDRVDHLASLDPEDDRRIKRRDRSLLKKADYVFVNSPYALRYVRKYNRNSFLVPCGCAVNLFQKKKTSIPGEMKRIKKPIIGLVGSLDHRIDFDLLYSLIRKRKDWSFVFIGSPFSGRFTQFKIVGLDRWLKKLQKLPNVYFFGKKPKEKAPNFIAGFDVCLIPYEVSLEFVKGCNPMKLYEYLAMGKPVVSTPIEAVKFHSPTVKITSDASSFEKVIEKIFKMGFNKKEAEKRKKIAQENSWQEKVKRMWQVVSLRVCAYKVSEI